MKVGHFFLLRLLEKSCLLFYSSVEDDYQYPEPWLLIMQRRSFLVSIVLQLRLIGGIQVPVPCGLLRLFGCRVKSTIDFGGLDRIRNVGLDVAG